jgi:hypothetical protein
MFKIVIFVHAVVSGWHDTYRVSTEFSSFKLCEAARPELADDFREILERQHMEHFEIESKCVKFDDEI